MPIAGLLFFCLPWLWLYNKRAVRLKSFAGNSPTRWNSSPGRAGRPLAGRRDARRRRGNAPICKEFARVYDEQNLGIPLEEA